MQFEAHWCEAFRTAQVMNKYKYQGDMCNFPKKGESGYQADLGNNKLRVVDRTNLMARLAGTTTRANFNRPIFRLA